MVEQWLTRGAARTRYLTVRVLTFCLAAVVSISLTSAAIYLGAAGTGSSLDSTAFAEISLALLGLTLLCYTIAMALAQLVSTRNSCTKSELGFTGVSQLQPGSETCAPSATMSSVLLGRPL